MCGYCFECFVYVVVIGGFVCDDVDFGVKGVGDFFCDVGNGGGKWLINV